MYIVFYSFLTLKKKYPGGKMATIYPLAYFDPTRVKVGFLRFLCPKCQKFREGQNNRVGGHFNPRVIFFQCVLVLRAGSFRT